MDFGDLMFAAVKNRQNSTAKLEGMTASNKKSQGGKVALEEKRRKLLEQKELESMERKAAQRKSFVQARRKEKAERERQQQLRPKMEAAKPLPQAMRNADRKSMQAYQRALKLMGKPTQSVDGQPASKASDSSRPTKGSSVARQQPETVDARGRGSAGMNFQALMQLAQNNAKRTVSDLEADLQKPPAKPRPPESNQKRVVDDKPKRRKVVKMSQRLGRQDEASSRMSPPSKATAKLNTARSTDKVESSACKKLSGRQSTVVQQSRSATQLSTGSASKSVVSSRQQTSRRRLDSYEETDSDLDDFIDDSEAMDLDASQEIRRMFNYDPTKYRHLDMMDDRCMMASFKEVCQEESRSSRLGLAEDIAEFKRQSARNRGSKRVRCKL